MVTEMTDTSYRIVHREDDSFDVQITRVGALPQTAGGFATEAAAQGWIAQDKRLRSSAEPVSSSTGRRWRSQ